MSTDAVGPFAPRMYRFLGPALLLWTAVWLVVGVIVAVQVWQLSGLSDSLARAGEALDTAGSGLEVVGRLPLVGDAPARLGEDVRQAADQVRRSADATRRNVRILSVLIGTSIVVIPVAPLLGLFVPGWAAHRREVRAIRRTLRRTDDTTALEELLARRAVHTLPFDVVRRVTPDPWGDLAAGRFRALANAELTRLGLAERAATGGDGWRAGPLDGRRRRPRPDREAPGPR